MVKTKIKRAVSFVMATVLSLSAFMSIGTSTAFAASGEKTKVYMVDFPRDGDANYDGVWGHSNLTLKNGWHTGSSTHTNLKAIGSYSGNIAYCIEPGVSLSSGQSMNKYDENYFNKDVNGDGKLDDGDELIGNLEETATGIYEMKELLYGKYLVRETKAPEGFVLDKGVYSVFIEKDETTYKVENKAGVGFINEAMKGNLKIKKTSSDGKVEGFTFRVTGVNGYDSTFTTDKNGEISVDGLHIGEYTVSEVSDNVSAGYILPADKKVTVKVGETVEIEMHNKLRDTPKTGDDRKTGLWVVFAGASALGIVATVVASKRKKKKEGNE